MVLKTRIAPYARLDNMPGFLRSGHILAVVGQAIATRSPEAREVNQRLADYISRGGTGFDNSLYFERYV